MDHENLELPPSSFSDVLNTGFDIYVKGASTTVVFKLLPNLSVPVYDIIQCALVNEDRKNDVLKINTKPC